MSDRTDRLKAVIIDLLHNADANHDGTGEWRKDYTPEELAGDMIAYADDAFEPFMTQRPAGQGEADYDLDELEREIVACLRELP